ncbi:protein of unknown function [Taphrina deformans PYCC 5710]|uniref:Spindle assembly checkpoint component MAD1 n=1 Tax=Taphrina deformans (strain PYCC 5710 / ATCC 11124 / CBS 356.35 / IMI 108563 / JCM 9778 / NBRC 8474) TaxID=1097556 RepID=R4XM75_TAPDE|nr:protein of unknown function [Taphrina deformans PYCC 5710]|eukprot:CCG84400.1 protein of unknown function [Taphrina deformans PYCC 5710]
MPVTHSPGNPFAFSPAKLRGPSYQDAEDFKHFQSPAASLRNPSVHSSPLIVEQMQRRDYAMKELKENMLHDQLIKDARIEELERLLLEESKKMERTESDKRFLFELQEKQATEITTLKDDLANVKRDTDSTVRELRSSIGKMKDDQIMAEDSLRASEQTHHRELSQLQSSLDNQKRAMDALKADLTHKNDMLSEKNQRITDLEYRCDEQATQNTSGTAEDLAFVTKELAEALSKNTILETSNASQLARIHQLQDATANMTVLKEEKLSLETKVQVLDSLRQELAEAQIRLIDLEKERSTWSGLLEETDEIDISAVLSKQKAAVETANSQMRLLEEQLNDANTLGEELSSQLSGEKKIVVRLDRSKSLATREITFLREQLKSYDLEEALESPNFDALKVARIDELEKIVDEYRTQLAQIPAPEEVKMLTGTKRAREEGNDFNEIERGEYLRKIRSLNAELEITKKEDVLIRKEMETLKAAHKVLASASNPTGSPQQHRILQYKNNPTSTFQAIRTQTLKDLCVENDALLAELAGRGGPTVPIQSLRNAETEMRQLEDAIKQKEKLMRRLKEVFSAKSSEFREAVYSLLGYKLDFLPNGRVRLSSMYAEQTDHAFIFDGEAGTMQLSGDEGGNGAFMASVDNLIKYWSGERNSIPGMLSALTLELLDKAGTEGDK